MDWLDPHLCKLVYSSVVAVVSICGQFTTVIMATEPNTATVVPVPAEPKAQWNVAETNALLDHLVSNKSELRGIYREIQNYHNVSGAHWDNTRGAGIEGRTALEVFNNYVTSSTSRASMQPFANSGWIYYDKLAEIFPNGTGAQGTHTFHLAAAAAPVLADDDVEPGAEHVITTAAAATIIASAASASNNPVAATMELPRDTNFNASRLPILPPSTVASSIGTGKRTHDDASCDMESSTHLSSYLSFSGPLPSSTLVSAPPPAKKFAARGLKVSPATAVVGMQGSINRIGDILEKAVTAAPVPAPPLPPPPPPPPLVATALDRAMILMQTEDVEVPAEDLGRLLLIFTSNERAMEIYVQSPLGPRRSYIKALLEAHAAK
ncbi:hypothetical protein DFJ58DRAFT_736613 [Suillus subalutaceus]|uniref:uncharacterized protein n=1 Tax=Suillus subalutaceus TaxID=48586 RepID=UPI001B883FFD|nr:uncharacterized protein DFJ58DRAFT_736613 [Suillus subalutaceus]KAG1831455.1 hypothetical protein DFJ58DRAFT_736613 [Suillus subalutaceus]